MAFTTVAWANLDIITEVKLDQMVANDVHLREEVGVRCAFSAAYPHDRAVHSSASPTLGFSIGALTLNSGGGGGGTFAPITGARNWDVSSLTKDTVQTLTVHVGSAGGSTIVQIPIYIHPDMNFLSIWAQTKIAGADGSGTYIRELVVLASRIDKGF